MSRRRSGPKLATKLISLGMILLIIPWLGIKSLNSMKAFLIEGQAQAQLLTAQGIASLLNDRPEFFYDIPRTADGFAELPLYPAATRLTLDGYDEDWHHLHKFTQHFGAADQSLRFSLLLSEKSGYLYGFIKVNDNTQVTRHPGYLRMDNSDHVRLYLKADDGRDKRILITFEGYGNITAFKMDEDWQYAEPGAPEYRVKGYVVLHRDGYHLEFRLPLNLLGASKQLGIEVADVSDADTREVTGTVGTFPRSSNFPVRQPNIYNPVIVRSTAAETFLAGLQEDNARLWIMDNRQRVRAVAGKLDADNTDETPQENSLWRRMLRYLTTDMSDGRTSGGDPNPDLVHTRSDNIYLSALAGQPGTESRPAGDGRSNIITAAYPITADNQVVGALLLEKSTANILQAQRRALENMVALTLLSLLVVTATLLLFALRLTYRIRRLGRDAGLNIDDYGRLKQLSGIRGRNAGDELGDLAQIIETMLKRLNQHQQFLTNIPRTLRHEINNPLNTIGTSLEQLEQTNPSAVHIGRARRGLDRIRHIVSSLSEAVSLEAALEADEMAPLDLTKFLTVYTRHQSAQCSGAIALRVPDEPVIVKGSGDHLEQLLDKLLDNARDFADAGSTIEVKLVKLRRQCRLTVANRGPTIPDGNIDKLFQLMGSYRDAGGGAASDNGRQNFGLGLYIARIIAEHHGGEISIGNLEDGSGVKVKLLLLLDC